MKGPSPAERRSPARDATADARPSRSAEKVAGLLDLPDALLCVVARRVVRLEEDSPCDGRPALHALLPLLLTCRRLAAVGYRSVERLSIRRTDFVCGQSGGPLSSAGDELALTPGQRTARRLASLCAFLSRVHHVHDVALYDVAGQTPREAGALGTFRLWWDTLLAALAHLPIRSLSAHAAAVSALAAAPPAGAVPLRRLHLRFLLCVDDGHGRGAAAVVARHRRSLEDLHVTTVGAAAAVDGCTDEAWSLASLLADAGTLPALTSLALACRLTPDGAAAVAAACPALECFQLHGEDGLDDDAVWGAWALPAALPRLSTLEWWVDDAAIDGGAAGAGLSLLLRGRRLHRLAVGRQRAGTLLPVRADVLDAAAALPAELALECTLPCPHAFVVRLLDGPVDVAPLHTLTLAAPELSSGTLGPLWSLPGLTHLTLLLDAPAITSWPLQPRLRHLRVTHRAAVTPRAWAPMLLTALDDGCLHLGALEALVLERARWEPILDDLIAAAAPHLPALRRLTVGRAEWTLVRGSVVGRPPAPAGA